MTIDTNTFRKGLLISIAPAVITTVYEFCRNNTLENLLYFVPGLLFLTLASAMISYVTLKEALDKDTIQASGLWAYIVAMAIIIMASVWIFITLKIQNAYILLPVVIAMFGSLAFILASKLTTSSGR